MATFSLHPPAGPITRQGPTRKTDRRPRHRIVDGARCERVAPSTYRIDSRDLWLRLDESTGNWDLLTADGDTLDYATSLAHGVSKLRAEGRIAGPEVA